MAGLIEMREVAPIASTSPTPYASGGRRAGQRRRRSFVAPLARAAAALGVDALFVETHRITTTPLRRRVSDPLADLDACSTTWSATSATIARAREVSFPRIAPECLVLEPRSGVPASDLPPVRIFLGSEPAQQRAERVFVWSIERVRDPARRYEIHVMKDLAGFTARRWTTGFTQYRFAIPHFAGRRGRAIYNDVDQIYCCDPALLFDSDLEGCGFRSATPEETSVMLLDCEQMAQHWTLAAAQRENKHRLHDRARTVPGLWGALDPTWNVRDDERPPADARLSHYTALHTQPWRPFRRTYVYQPNPVGGVWHSWRPSRCAGFLPRTRERPSDRYAAWVGDAQPRSAVPRVNSCRRCPEARPPSPFARSAPEPGWTTRPDDDVPVALGRAGAGARERLVLTLPACARRQRRRWERLIEAARARHPALGWELDFGNARRAGGLVSPNTPRVWGCATSRPASDQALGLAEALAWPYEVKHMHWRARLAAAQSLARRSDLGIDSLASSPLEAALADLVIAAGRRSAPIAQWIRERARDRRARRRPGTQGRRRCRALRSGVTPCYTRLFPHPNRIETDAAAAPRDARSAGKASEEWVDRLADAPRRGSRARGGTSAVSPRPGRSYAPGARLRRARPPCAARVRDDQPPARSRRTDRSRRDRRQFTSCKLDARRSANPYLGLWPTRLRS